MTRIQPECFIEVYSDSKSTNQQDKREVICDIEELSEELDFTQSCSSLSTIALFLIKPTNTPLFQRLEARALNNTLKP